MTARERAFEMSGVRRSEIDLAPFDHENKVRVLREMGK